MAIQIINIFFSSQNVLLGINCTTDYSLFNLSTLQHTECRGKLGISLCGFKSSTLLRFKADFSCYFSCINTKIEGKYSTILLQLENQMTLFSVVRNHKQSATIVYCRIQKQSSMFIVYVFVCLFLFCFVFFVLAAFTESFINPGSRKVVNLKC